LDEHEKLYMRVAVTEKMQRQEDEMPDDVG